MTGFGFGTHLEATKLLSGNVGQGTLSLHSPSTSLQLTSMSLKAAYTLAPIFATAAQETPQIAWLWWPLGLTLPVPQDCIYLHFLKAAA